MSSILQLAHSLWLSYKQFDPKHFLLCGNALKSHLPLLCMSSRSFQQVLNTYDRQLGRE